MEKKSIFASLVKRCNRKKHY